MNGLIVTVGRVPSLVVTLGTLYIIRGIDGAWAGGNQVNASMLPDSFNKIGYATVLGSRTSAGSGSSPSRSPPTRCAASERPATSMPSARSRRGAARRHPGRIARLPRLRAERRHRRGHRGAVAVLVRVGRCDRGRRVRVPGDRRRRRRRCGDLRRGGTVLGAALGALLLYTINSALVVVNVSSFWSMALSGALLLAAIAFDRLIALRVAPAMRTRRRTRG